MGITADELNQPKFDGLGALSYPDLHEESVPRLNLFRMSSKLLQTCGCHEFSLQDLVKPTSDKLRIYLSSVINFAKFREDQLDVFSVKTEKQDQLASDLEDKTSNIDTLTRKIDEINVQHEKDMPVIIDLQEQKKALKSEMKARGEEHKKSLKEKDHIKEEYNAVSDKTASIQYQIQNLEADIESLSTQVVQSPDRLKAELSELDRRYAEETNVLRDMEQQKEVDSAQERIRLDAIKHLKKTMEHMRTLEKQQKKYKEAYKTFKANKSKISSLESELTEQNALNEHYVHRTSTCGKKQEAIDDQSSDRTQIQTLKKQQGEYDILNLAHEGGKQELQSILCDIENVKNQTKSDIEAHKQRMHKQFQLLKTTVDNFHVTNDNFVAALE
jgi:kinetochore protein Nuf2